MTQPEALRLADVLEAVPDPLWPNQSNMDEKETPPVAPPAPQADDNDDNDFPLGKAFCDLSDDGSCEACQ